MNTTPVAAGPQQAVEIWIRTKGARRQAMCRRRGASGWNSMSVPLADKALRTGLMPSGPMAGAKVLAWNPVAELPPHPMRAAFASQAQLLNRQIDALIRTGASA